MEKLRDKAFSRFKSRILREEQKLIDEAATRNFQHRKRL
jgi:flagellar biosynthesis chaperone FliJ